MLVTTEKIWIPLVRVLYCIVLQTQPFSANLGRDQESKRKDWRKVLLYYVNRKDLAMLVMCCTWHNFLRKHRFLQKRIAVRKCRLCEYEEESSLHIIAHCPAFELPRFRSFINQELDLTQIDLDQLSCFIRDTKISRMLTLEEIQI